MDADLTRQELADERRGSLRRRVLKGCTLRFNGGYGAMEGVVRNLSEEGARLVFGDSTGVPPRFDLQIAGETAWRPATVRWRRAREVGIALA